jgi:DNA polymerase-3 subunit alpha
VGAAKKDGMSALALTDSGNLYGALEFYKTCKKEGIKPIIGIDAYVAARTRFDKEPGIDNRRARLILLAQNNTGYKNLLSLVTESYLDGFYYKPRIDRELMQKYAKGLIAIVPSFSGEPVQSLKAHDPHAAQQKLQEYSEIFGSDNVFLEITHHPEIDGHQELQKQIEKLSKKTGVPLVAAHDVYYLKPEDRKARETMVKIQTGTDFRNEQSGFGESIEDFSFISATTAKKYFSHLPNAIENTAAIAERITLELELGKWVFPKLELKNGKTADEELRAMVYRGIEDRGLETTAELAERVEYELKIIRDKGYASYFLTVADLLHYAHRNHILTTIRGSVAGSMVTYLARITNVDPMAYNIPFERFLNPERPTAPDIDMDFADNRRDEVINYAKEKYGSDKVAQIGTFGTMMARAAVRDVARALGHPYATGDRIAKLIPLGSQGFPMTLARALKVEPELAALYKENSDAREIIDLARKIEGCARHISVHAAGVVIAPTALTNFVPLQYDPKGGSVITQYNMHAVEDAGLLKFDFLGIKNLAILADAVLRVKRVYGTDIDIENIPLNDKKTFETLARGETMGLFQLNGSGMTRFLKDLRPTTIHDINAMVALYRPGPMESIPAYIERKHNPRLVHYLDPRMKEILETSYGVITYQDDVLMIATKLAGYTWLEADKLRKAMGKKIPAEMEAQREKFTEGAVANGLSPQKAKELWKLIEPFAAYGFNKAHAASYGKVAYQTAYMKANYPTIYMAAVLSADAGDVEKIAESITECVRMGILVLPPNINESIGDFTVVENEAGKPAIRFGLRSIKNFGEGIGNVIIEEREQNGKYASLPDFLERVHDRNLNKKSLESLIKSGALDPFGERGTMLANIDMLLSYGREYGKLAQNQSSLFGDMRTGSGASSLALEESEPASQAERLSWEKELLGLYVSGHPLDQYQEKLRKRGKTITEIKESFRDGMPVILAGIVEEMKPIFTKSGDKMAFVRVADYEGSIEAVLFPRILSQYHDLVAPQQCIALKGRISNRSGEKSMIVEAVKSL